MGKCKKDVFLVPKMGHDLKHDEFRSVFHANPEVGASKDKFCGADV